ncbi:transcriptional regulator GlxA family with amidase domain [Rhizomicrobium palustre]|uniref:Transcriptional regulator GlxA family with amidase domain n=2 Tax=Rhizomicrobium palustre TaxID=189966 RepID=A0A846MUZ0_9PROT|nr:transcriptional regulator GlxA family with amidase domain [Rhizomicrobium palustre]
MLVSPGFQVMALGVQTAFELANIVTEEAFYTVHLVSLTGGMVETSLGFKVETKPLAALKNIDTLMLLAGTLPPDDLPPDTIKTLKTTMKRARRVAGLCTGGFLMAQTGVLNGKRATTHWLYAKEMRARFPEITVEDDRIFINEGPYWTSAGLTAGLDLAVGLVEKDLGAEVARSVAHKLVMHHRRAGGQSQHSELLELAPKTDRIQNALIYARKHLKNALSVEELAEVARLSPRQFSRAFRIETGQSPAKAVEQLRLEQARILLEETTHPLETVAQETGFQDLRRMRETFMRRYGQPPQTIRRSARMAV